MTEIQEYQDHAEVAGNDLKKRKKMIFITIAATLAILTIYAVFAAYQSMYAHANNIKYTQLEINPDTDLEEAQLNIFLDESEIICFFCTSSGI